MPQAPSAKQLQSASVDLKSEGSKLSKLLDAALKAPAAGSIKAAAKGLKEISDEIDAIEGDIKAARAVATDGLSEAKKADADKKKALAEIEAITVSDVLYGSSPHAKPFMEYCRKSHNLVEVSFLTDLREKNKIDYLLRQFINAGAPDEVNISSALRKEVLAAAAITDPKPSFKIFDKIRRELEMVVNQNMLKDYKSQLKEALNK